MKKLLFVFVLFTALVSTSSAQESRKGFLTSKWCAQNGYFSDCRLETSVCASGDCYKEWDFGDTPKEELVLFVHDEGKLYDVKLDGLKRYKLDTAIHRNEVELIGNIKGDTIYAKKYNAPPPPKKSFFKGCL